MAQRLHFEKVKVRGGKMGHAYPQDLAAFVAANWSRVEAKADVYGPPQPELAGALPPIEVLEEILSTCFLASLLVEEQRAVTFRVIYCDPDYLPEEEGPPTGLHRLVFDEPQRFNSHELRRLSPAASFERSLIGLRFDQQLARLELWGVVHSGPRWLRLVRGGRIPARALPPLLVVCASGRGRIEVCKGSTPIAQLTEGRILSASMNVFESEWLPAAFADARKGLQHLHDEARVQAGKPWADLDGWTIKYLGQNIVKRIIATIRANRHGGTLLYVQPERIELLEQKNSCINFKYRFRADEPRFRFRTLLLRVMQALAEAGGERGAPVSWNDYELSHDITLASLDEALFELAHFVANLASVDGAVVLTRYFELIGFGGIIACEDTDVSVIARALDLEGEQVCFESTATVGTRHRSAFRICHQWHDAIAIVISQDSGVRFARWKDGSVTCWYQQTLLSALD